MINLEYRVWIADDTATFRTTNQLITQNCGTYIVIHEFEDGAEVWDALQKDARLPHLLLTDMNMKHMDGDQLIDLMRKNERYQNIPIVLIAALDPADSLRQRVGIPLLAKPYASADLTALVRKYDPNNAEHAPKPF